MMKRLNTLNRNGFKLLFIMLFMVSSATALAQSQSPIIKLVVNAGETALGVYSTQDTASCAVTGGWGSICFAKGRKGKITFQLHGNNPCSRADGANWVLKSVVAGGEGSSTKPASAADWGGLSKGAASDLSADATTGVLATEPPTNDVMMTVNDENQHEFVLWYKVVAECKLGENTYGDDINLDPRVRNGGID